MRSGEATPPAPRRSMDERSRQPQLPRQDDERPRQVQQPARQREGTGDDRDPPFNSGLKDTDDDGGEGTDDDGGEEQEEQARQRRQDKEYDEDDFTIWTLNAQKKSFKDAEFLAEALDRSCRWSVVALQEMGTKEAVDKVMETRKGHNIFISSSMDGAHSTTIMVHRYWTSGVREVRHGRRWTYVLLYRRQGPRKA